MRLLTRRHAVLAALGIAIACSRAYAQSDPIPRSSAALRGLVEGYRSTIVQMLKFEAVAPAHIATSSEYLVFRDQLLATMLQGLDNLNSQSANELIIDLSAVYLGESTGPLYSCVVQRRSSSISSTLGSGRQLNDWCFKALPVKVCLQNEEAASRLLSAIGRAKKHKCDLQLY